MEINGWTDMAFPLCVQSIMCFVERISEKQNNVLGVLMFSQ